MIIPSFAEYAPKPNTAQAFLGGVASAQKDTEEQDQLAMHAQQLQIAQSRLQQEAYQNNMELQVKQQTLQQQMLIHQQQLNIENQYKQAMIGIDSQKVQQAGEHLKFQVGLEASKRADEAEWTDRVQGGEDPADVATEMGARTHLPGAAFSRILRDANDEGAGTPGTMTDADENGGKVFWNTKNHAQYINPQNNLAADRLDVQRQNSATRSQSLELNAAMKLLEKDDYGSNVLAKKNKGDKLTKEEQAAADRHMALQRNVDRLSRFSHGAADIQIAPDEKAPKKRLKFNPKTGDFE